MAGSARETWAKRVERWVDSGLTANQFAGEIGVNPRTLVYWKWRLAKEQRASHASKPKRRSSSAIVPSPLSFVEVTPAKASGAERPIEVELVTGERVRVTDDFDPSALRRVLEVLAARR